MNNLVKACHAIAQDAADERVEQAIEESRDLGISNRTVRDAWTFIILGLFVAWCAALTALAVWIAGGK